MSRTSRRSAAFVALWRALRSASRGGPTLGQRALAFPRLIGASLRPREGYDGLGRLGLMVTAFAYLLWPLDLVPEILLGPIGLIDDTIVVAWLAGAMLAETDRFLEGEGDGPHAGAGPVAGEIPGGRER
jgi:hypothetical protein